MWLPSRPVPHSEVEINEIYYSFLKSEWDARLMMERSLALKSPSIHYHLAGTKKVRGQSGNGTLSKKIWKKHTKKT